MEIIDFRILLDKYLLDGLSPEERTVFLHMLEQPRFSRELETALQESFMNDTYEGVENRFRNKRMEFLLKQKMNSKKKPSGRALLIQFKKFAVAASIVIALATAAFFALHNPEPRPVAFHKMPQINGGDVLPGHEGATLKLSDGTTIKLDDSQNGLIAQQGNIRIIKKNGGIYYEGKNAENLYNKITTDRGRQWLVVLPDGSKAWLNANSYISYPLAFSPKERVVEMAGEAYFEVVHNPKIPFKVKVEGKEIEVLGTHFNVNSYEDEPSLKATLLEGSIAISNGQSMKRIHPGQEAAIELNSPEIRINDVDVQNAVAWKNGYFSFHNASLETVMRQLSRWYDIEVVYPSNIPALEFEGAIDRSLNLSAVLRILERTGVKSKIENKKLIILK